MCDWHTDTHTYMPNVEIAQPKGCAIRKNHNASIIYLCRKKIRKASTKIGTAKFNLDTSTIGD